jgi:magnesium transporter
MERTTLLLLPDVAAALERDPKSVVEMTEELHPADVADLCAALSDRLALALIQALDVEHAARVLEGLDPHKRAILAESLAAADKPAMIELVEEMAPDEAADLVADLRRTTQTILLAELPQEEQRELRHLMAYPDSSAGALMTNRFISVTTELTVQGAIDQIRTEAAEMETINTIYAADRSGVLLGAVSLRDLVVSPAEKRISDVMAPNVISVSDLDDRAEVVRVATKYSLLALPVVDPKHRIVGIITVDDIVDVAQEEATKDIQKFGGVEELGEPYLQIGFLDMVKKRGGWLAALFIGEMLTASAMASFEGEIQRAVVLALFVPLIISSGGNSGSQASTLIIRAMALGQLSGRDWWKVVRRELGTGIALGLGLGIIGFLRIVIWQAVTPTYGEHYLLVAATVFLSLIGVVLFGTLSGSVLPLLLRRLGFDPASASAPFVATLVDVTGLVIYFSAAALILHGTLL